MDNSEKLVVTPNYLMIRALKQTPEVFKLFFESSLVAVGWSEIDFSQNTLEDIFIKVKVQYFKNDKASQSVKGRRLAAIKRFKAIKEGDRLIIPHLTSFRFAEATAKVQYDEQSGNDLDLANQREVKYLMANGEFLEVPRSAFTSKLQSRLKVRGSIVRDLKDFKIELGEFWDRATQSLELDPLKRMEIKNLNCTAEFQSALLDRIQGRKLYLEAGGRGLEKLVLELLFLDGYKARIQSTSASHGPGDVDILATKNSHQPAENLCIQIKHHHGSTSAYAAEQLINARKQYSPCTLRVVTSAKPDTKLKVLCERNSIELWDGQKLVEWIYSLLDKISSDTKLKLGIADAPMLLDI
ncbi:MAG: restriction endonuclease [candidate division Zixibacteria bacterium]|nr:restriction endonuclease [candidate division Zixibacteria bacterium]